MNLLAHILKKDVILLESFTLTLRISNYDQ